MPHTGPLFVVTVVPEAHAGTAALVRAKSRVPKTDGDPTTADAALERTAPFEEDADAIATPHAPINVGAQSAIIQGRVRPSKGPKRVMSFLLV
jgi:hypothetical protein